MPPVQEMSQPQICIRCATREGQLASLALAVTHLSQEMFEADMAAIAAEKADPAAQLQAYLDYWEHNLIHDPEAFCVDL